MDRLPSIFVSHGAPTLPFENVPARDFLKQLGNELPRPRAIIAVSAHDIGREAIVGSAAQMHAIHDFSGFSPALYELQYSPQGDPELAQKVMERLQAIDINVVAQSDGGIDHGVWVPLMLMYPQADIPVVSLSLTAAMSEVEHVAIGQALASLRDEGVLIMGSGSLTHNLRDVVWGADGSEPLPYAKDFADWVTEQMETGTTERLLHWRTDAPHAKRAHPSVEHFMPLFVALGAGGEEPKAQALHQSYTYGALAMYAFAFH